jgi:hypothetical protein
MTNSKTSSKSSGGDNSPPQESPNPTLFPGQENVPSPASESVRAGAPASEPLAPEVPTPRPTAEVREKASLSEKDYLLKLETAQALCSAGYFVRMNVALSEPLLSARGAQKLTDITDVDVLATRFATDFHPDTVCVSCKAGSSKSLSPIKETLMMAGVMRYLKAERGYAIFADRKIDAHMYGLAQQLDIALFPLEEWKLWKGRQVGNQPVPAHFTADVYVMLKEQLGRRNDLDGLFGYTRGEYWYYRDFRNIQNLVGVTRRNAKSLSGTLLGRFAFLDLLSLFSLSVLQLCEFVTFTGASRLAETLPPYLFGGPSVYKSRRELLRRVEEMLRAREILEKDQQLPPLDPAYLTDLAEVVARYSQKPIDAIRVPQQINYLAGLAASEATGITIGGRDSGESSTTEKFAFDIATLLVKAARVDKDVLSLF